jgi:hypothetical protein
MNAGNALLPNEFAALVQAAYTIRHNISDPRIFSIAERSAIHSILKDLQEENAKLLRKADGR